MLLCYFLFVLFISKLYVVQAQSVLVFEASGNLPVTYHVTGNIPVSYPSYVTGKLPLNYR